MTRLKMVSPAAIDNNKTDSDPWAMDWFANNTAGTGAYQLDYWNRGAELVLAKNPDYWGWPDNSIDQIIWVTVAEAQSRLLMVKGGDLDIVLYVPPNQAVEYVDAPGIASQRFNSSVGHYCPINTQKGPLQDKKVRQAITAGFDYQAFIDFNQGFRWPAHGTTAAGLPGFNPESADPAPTIPSSAKSLLAESDYPDGGFDVTYRAVKGNALGEFVGTLLQQNLAELEYHGRR